MKLFRILPLLALAFASCANDPYENAPEGTVSDSEPDGYEEMVYGGITYWHWHNHYYRYWPNYGWIVVRPPHGRPPYPRPPKPEHPIERPPNNRPPSVQPLPETRPSYPSTRPSTRPSIQPTPRPMPSARPALRR